MEDLLRVVEYYGFLPLFLNDIPGFSVEEMYAPVYWFAEDATARGSGKVLRRKCRYENY